MIKIKETEKELTIYAESPVEEAYVRRLLTVTEVQGTTSEVVHVWHSENPIRTFRGYKDYLAYHLKNNGFDCEIEEYKLDLSNIPQVDPDILDGVTLYDFQQMAVRKALIYKRGVILSPVGSGKTIMAMAFMKHHNLPSVIVVPSTYLEDQFYSEMKRFGFDVVKLSKTSESYILNNKPKYIVGVFKSVLDLVSKLDKNYYRCLIFDEYHHGQANTWRKIYYNMMDADYIIGFTGTLYRDFDFDYRRIDRLNIQDFITMGMSTKVIFRISYNTLVDEGILAKPIIYICPIRINGIATIQNWQVVFKRGIENSKVRNNKIVEFIRRFYDSGKVVMVLSSTLNHIRRIADLIPPEIKQHTRIYKGNRVGYYFDEIRWVPYRVEYDDIDSLLDRGELRVILSTTVFNEGVNFPHVDGVILAFSGKAYTRTVQMIGRAVRRRDNKDKCFVIDFYDMSHSYLRSQSEKRIKIYKSLDFEIITDDDVFWNIVNENASCDEQIRSH